MGTNDTIAVWANTLLTVPTGLDISIMGRPVTIRYPCGSPDYAGATGHRLGRLRQDPPRLPGRLRDGH